MDDWDDASGGEHEAEIDDFWEEARAAAGLTAEAVPPAWSFADLPALADELLGLVLDGTKTATSSLQWYYDEGGETMPAVGDLSIVLDSTGRPRALIRTTEVEIRPFEEISDRARVPRGRGGSHAGRLAASNTRASGSARCRRGRRCRRRRRSSAKRSSCSIRRRTTSG